MRSHKDLKVWQESVDFVVDIYQVTREFPKEKLYGLVSQLRRAAVSVPSNIAEGAGRQTKKEFIHFLYISLASLSEIETQLVISQKLNYLQDFSPLEKKLILIRYKLLGLIKSQKKT